MSVRRIRLWYRYGLAPERLSVKITPSKLRDFFKSPEAYTSVLLYGSDCSRVGLYTQKILDLMNRNGEFVIHRMVFAQVAKDPEQLLVNMMTVPMFNQKSLILLTDAKDALGADFKAALEKINPQHCYVIIQARELPGASTLKDYYNRHKTFAAVGCYKEDSVGPVVDDFLSQHGISHTKEAFRLLCDSLQQGSACIQSELEKLLLYLGKDKNLSTEDVQKSLATDLDPVLDDLCVAIADGNLEDFLKLADALFQNKIAPVLIIRSCLKYFMRVEYLIRKTRDGESIDQAMRSIQPPVFFRLVPRLKKHALSLPYKTVQLILGRLLETEIQCKLSDTTQEMIFKYLMCSLTLLVKRVVDRQTTSTRPRPPTAASHHQS
ncbi:MAG: DNA polymerase III subunit delta [Anaplasma sp.]